MLVYELFLVVCLGLFLACVASFFNVVIYRTNREESFVKGRSACEQCKHQLSWLETIPLISFMWLLGRCRTCHKRIDRTHFLFELASFLSAFAWYVWSDLSWLSFVSFLCWFVLAFVVISDLKYLLIPDLFIFLLTVFAGVLAWQTQAVGIESMYSIVSGVGFLAGLYAVAQFFLGKEALGLGDIKLMVPLSLLLPWPLVWLCIFLAFISGGIFAMLILVMRKKKFGQALPFAPFLIFAFVISWLFGDQVWQWYFGLLL